LPAVKTVTVPTIVSVFDLTVPEGVSALVSLFASRVVPTCLVSFVVLTVPSDV
jgi:hypothetical protein